MGRASRHALDRYERELRPLGLTGTEAMVLGMLGRGTASLKELAGLWEVNPSMMSRVVDRLVARGLAERREDPRDRRRMIVAATPAGREIGRLAVEAGERVTARMTSAMDEERVASFKESLRLVVVALLSEDEDERISHDG
jgi:DNA-binding MarR family transcriptional regulator